MMQSVPLSLSNPAAHFPTYNPFRLLRMIGFFSPRAFRLSDVPDLSNKIALVTGGQAGIGREITAQLLLHGVAKVYILGRSEEKFLAAKKEWVEQRQLEEADIDKRTEFLACDLGDLRQVKKAADTVAAKSSRLDIVINNAGITVPKTCNLSPQGIENTFAVNHLGHFALTNLLLPLIERTAQEHGGARIANTTSCFHLVCQDIDFSLLTVPDSIKSPAVLDSIWRYGRSKLANILFTRELARRLDKKGMANVFVNSFYPGNVTTDAMDEWQQHFGTAIGGLIKSMFSFTGQSPEDAAATALFLAASPEVESHDLRGRYFIPVASESSASQVVENKDLSKNLWYWSDSKVAETLGRGWQETANSAA